MPSEDEQPDVTAGTTRETILWHGCIMVQETTHIKGRSPRIRLRNPTKEEAAKFRGERQE
jgi:hypothetical protein